MPAWINEMASFMKELDPNHLVTSGGEGFWGADNKRADNNPQMPASRCELQARCWPASIYAALCSIYLTCCPMLSKQVGDADGAGLHQQHKCQGR